MEAVMDIIELYDNGANNVCENNFVLVNFLETYMLDHKVILKSEFKDIEFQFFKKVKRENAKNWYDYIDFMNALIKYHPDVFIEYVKTDKTLYQNLLEQQMDVALYIQYKETSSIIKCYFAGIQNGCTKTKTPPLKIASLGLGLFNKKSKPKPFWEHNKITSPEGIRTISKMYKYFFLLTESRVLQYVSLKGKRRYNNIFETECKEYYAYKYWKMYLGYKNFIRDVVNYHVQLNEFEKVLDLCQKIINIFKQEHNIPLAYATLHELKRNKTMINSSNFHNRFNSLRELEKTLTIHTSHITLTHKDYTIRLHDAINIVIKFQTTTNPSKIYEDIIRTKNAIIDSKILSFDVNQIDIEVYNALLGNEN